MDLTLVLLILVIFISILLDRWLTAGMVKRWLSRFASEQKLVVLLFGIPSPFLTSFLKYRRFNAWMGTTRRYIKLALPIVVESGEVNYVPIIGNEPTPDIGEIVNTLKINGKRNSLFTDQPKPRDSPKKHFVKIGNIPFLRSGWSLKAPTRAFWLAFLELTLIAAWALWVGRSQLNLNIEQIPVGREYPLQVQSNFVWQMLPKCGICMLWNGTVDGGSPSFVELQGAVLHPAVIVTTLLFGMINGGKALLLLSLFMAGLAVWWLARVMGLGLIARLWAGAMAVVGGNIVGKIENGDVIVMFSTACACLVLAPLLELVLTGRRRAIIWIGITLALTWLSGQGYMQIAVLAGILPPFALIFLTKGLKKGGVYIDFLLGLGLSLLLSGVLLIPVLHFSPYLVKDTDSNLNLLQQIQYAPLNLIISDVDFFRNQVLGQTGAAYVFLNYIGWVPILFSLASLRFVTREKIRLLLFFLITILWLYVISTADFVHPLMKILPSISNVRNPPLFQGMVIPLILGLAAWGLDLLVKKIWPRFGLWFSSGKSFTLSAAWILLGTPMLIGLYQNYQFNQLLLKPVDSKISSELVQSLKTTNTQWVGVPLGENFWTLRMFDQNVKIACIFRPWHFKDHPCPQPYLEATRFKEDIYKPGFETIVDGMNVIRHEDQQYASIRTKNGASPCIAQAIGGDIDVFCNSEYGGTLMVKENYFSGWSVWVDGNSQPMLDGPLLAVSAAAGTHTYQFRYRPWDVWVGLAVTGLGVALGIWIVFFYHRPEKNKKANAPDLE